MLKELSTQKKLVGLKQSFKAVREGRAQKVYVARDADPKVLEPLLALCGEWKIPVEETPSMAQLGREAGIKIGASVVTLLKE